jgi:hypothetical protein
MVGDSFFSTPYILPRRMNGAAYWHFLEYTVPQLLDTVLLDIQWNMWFMYDGIPAHFSYTTGNYLETAYAGWQIGRQGSVFFPYQVIHQIQLPLIFFVWGYLKNFVYASAVATTKELLQCIQNGCMSVCNNPDIFKHIHQSLSGQSFCGSARPTFEASTVTMKTIVTSCQWNVKLHF